MRRLLLIAAANVAATAAAQQAPAPLADMAMPPAAAACPAAPAPLPAALAGWSARVPVTAAANGERPPALTPGTGARAALLATPRLAFPVAPGHAGGAGSHGGVFAFTVAAAGRYRVALGGPAWIDVAAGGRAAGGRALASVAHAHGPACSGVTKMVDFDLQPGRYLLEVSDAGAATLDLMVARLPAGS